MTKKTLNQNAKYVQKLIDIIEPNFFFNDKPINRFKEVKNIEINATEIKKENLMKLKERINSIQNCNLRQSSKNLIMGDGSTDSQIMVIGETPGEEEDHSGLTFQGEIGKLLSKMFLAINIKREKIYYYILNKFPYPRR